MGLLQQHYKLIQLRRMAIRLQIPLRLRLTFRLFLGIMILVSGTEALTRFHQAPASPFAVYAEMIGGDPEFWSNDETLYQAAFELACTASMVNHDCLYKPDSGFFSEIRLMVLNDVGMYAIYFAVRDKTLTVGDLALLWGRPTITRRSNSLVLQWPIQHVSTVVRSESGLFNYQLPVPYLLVDGTSA